MLPRAVTVIDATLLELVITAVAMAPDPPPPEIETAGVFEYWLPAAVTTMFDTTKPVAFPVALGPVPENVAVPPLKEMLGAVV